MTENQIINEKEIIEEVNTAVEKAQEVADTKKIKFKLQVDE